jgi:hypothetical protein
MTTQDLGPGLAFGHDPQNESPDALGSLFESSPAPDVQTSAAAETAFLLGLFSLLAVPFELAMTLSVAMAAVALVTSIVGLARASKPRFAGGVLASLGLVFALATLALVGLRYIGVDTAVGDGFVPTLHDWLSSLNGLLPTP